MITIPDEVVVNKIYHIRGQKIMIDRDLAELYGIETRVLKQAVRRNLQRFPEDFMFEMSPDEFEQWRKDNAVSNKNDKMGLRHSPFCFTEQGVTMLSCVLNSARAIDVNIKVIRIFAKLREMLLMHKDVLLKLEQLENQVVQNSEEIQLIFGALRQLLNAPKVSRQPIGFKTKAE